ncbi:LOW QUALITY PROTEIN: uncharacterized protein LOC128636351 [Bombina bombina]|uniref:LOW QUALITY PROTEIN: uncharacterized protein LOC128636351 n=1 Tax=Bombina bombina TaxID=8345 RepID=UPI00235B24F9|nr:LOW QUALITY PROTEIN: uncharacterized protein LOC128636351 [Bombina bombina]
MQHLSGSPVELLAAYLSKASDLCKKIDGLPEELKSCVQKAFTLSEGLNVSKVTQKEEKDLPICKNIQSGLSGNLKNTGLQLYKLLLHINGAKTILQLPLCPEYDIKSLADCLPEDGKLVVRASESHPGRQQETSPYNKKIHVQYGSTADILKMSQGRQPITEGLQDPCVLKIEGCIDPPNIHFPNIVGVNDVITLLLRGEQFDMVFMDATEQNHINYYNLIINSNMLKMNGVMCVQNIFMKMLPSRENISDDNWETAAREMTNVINAYPGTEEVHLPVDGGISIARRKYVSAEMEVKDGIVKDVVFYGYNGYRILDRMRLDGKVAYVTGGGQGIGRAFAHALGEAGAKVAIVDMFLEKAEIVANELKLKGIQSVAIAADISKNEDVKRIMDTIVTNWGRIDIACNNAGINMNSASENTTLEEWDKTFNVNLRGLFMCCQASGRVMLSQGYGKIINTASMASLIVPHPQKQLAYNTSKAGVVKLTQTLGTEWIDRGVRVNCISPGIVDTPLIHSDALKPLVQRWLADIPAGRLAQVTDLQAAVVYLASEASDYMTGHNLVIEGGQSLW